MTSAVLHLAYTFQEYVHFERDARSKHEFVGGAILAMVGRTIEHGALCAAVLGMLRGALRGRRCRAYDSNARIRVAASGNAYYPDASVVCGELATDSTDQLSIVNPSLVVEVLSPSTAAFDAGEKLIDYQRIPSVNEIVLIHSEARRVDVYTREGDRFTLTSSGPGEQAHLPALGISLSLDELYHDPLRPAS